MTKNKKELDLSKIESEYDAISPLATSLCKELTRQISHLLDNSGIILGFPIQSRVKEIPSVIGKLKAQPKRFNNLLEMQDLVGLRIILLFDRNVKVTTELIKQNFEVVREYDTSDLLGADQFGYSSIHLVIRLPQDWLKVPTLASLGGFLVEIQIRTFAQHIWAEVSHRLQYKDEISVPPSMVRSIYRVSALLEIIDTEFERLLESREAYRATISGKGDEGVLNVDLLEKTMDSLLPPANKKDGEEQYSSLIQELDECGITNQQQLTELVEKRLSLVLIEDSHMADNELSQYEDTDAVAEPWNLKRYRQGVYFTHTGLIRSILDEEYGRFARRKPRI